MKSESLEFRVTSFEFETQAGRQTRNPKLETNFPQTTCMPPPGGGVG